MTGTAASLYVLGGLLEFAGVLLVAWPDFSPTAARVSRWIGRTSRRVLRRVGIKSGRTVTTSAAATATGEMRAAGIVKPGPSATLEAKVEHLIRRSEESQKAQNAMSRRVTELERAMRADLNERVETLTTEFDAKLLRAFEDDRPLRIVGTVLLALGLFLSVLANFH